MGETGKMINQLKKHISLWDRTETGITLVDSKRRDFLIQRSAARETQTCPTPHGSDAVCADSLTQMLTNNLGTLTKLGRARKSKSNVLLVVSSETGCKRSNMTSNDWPKTEPGHPKKHRSGMHAEKTLMN